MTGSDAISLSVSEFVALVNQTLEYAYPNVTITGELANFRVSKNRWVYFDLKDEVSSVKFFGTVYQLPGPLEDGLVLAVRGMPRLHPQYGFSVTIQSMQPVGEGPIKKASTLLEAKLAKEGLFDTTRKRSLPHPPKSIGLITSEESAAYRDFMKIITARWGGMEILLADVQVQGEPAVPQIVAAIEHYNQLALPPEVLVITRGGGSAEDLQAFSTEQVTRAVATSRIPTLVAIGHEVDISLAELAADRRASTPSNAAELLVPDRKAVTAHLHLQKEHLFHRASHTFVTTRTRLKNCKSELRRGAEQSFTAAKRELTARRQLLEAFSPSRALQRGYALVRLGSSPIRSGLQVKKDDELTIQISDARIRTQVKQVTME